MPLQYTWRASKFFIFFIKVRAVDIVTLGTDFLKRKYQTLTRCRFADSDCYKNVT